MRRCFVLVGLACSAPVALGHAGPRIWVSVEGGQVVTCAGPYPPTANPADYAPSRVFSQDMGTDLDDDGVDYQTNFPGFQRLPAGSMPSPLTLGYDITGPLQWFTPGDAHHDPLFQSVGQRFGAAAPVMAVVNELGQIRFTSGGFVAGDDAFLYGGSASDHGHLTYALLGPGLEPNAPAGVAVLPLRLRATGVTASATYYLLLGNTAPAADLAAGQLAGPAYLVEGLVGWNSPAGGTWAAGANWSAGVSPDSAATPARLGLNLLASGTVDLGATTRTVKSLTIENPTASYTLAGSVGGALVISGGGSGADLRVLSGTHAITAPVVLGGDVMVSIAAGAGLSVASVRGPHALTVAAGTLRVVGGGTSKVTGLTLAGGTVPSATLDLGAGKWVVDYTGATPLPTLVAQVRSARNGYDASVITRWDGKGITSTAARTASVGAGFDLYGIGAIDNASLADASIGRDVWTSFGGLGVDATSVLVAYTYGGDADLNGQVDGDDYALIDNAFNGLIPNFGWLSGDFDYDGAITGDDYALIDSGFLFQGAPIGAGATIGVPEPGGLCLLGAMVALGGQRRRRGSRMFAEAGHH